MDHKSTTIKDIELPRPHIQQRVSRVVPYIIMCDPTEMYLIIDKTTSSRAGLMNESPCRMFRHMKCCEDDLADV